MLTTLTGILIILYCLYNLLYIDKFIHKFHQAVLEYGIDALMTAFIVVWFVVEFFFRPGIVAAGPFLLVFINTNNPSEWRRRLAHRMILITIILFASFIVLNQLWFNLNFWTFNF